MARADVLTGTPTTSSVVGTLSRSSVVIWLPEKPLWTILARPSGTSWEGPTEFGWPSEPTLPASSNTGSNAPAPELATSWPLPAELILFTALRKRVRTVSGPGLSPSRSGCTSAALALACRIAAFVFASSSWLVICICSPMPSTKTTAEDSARVLTTTRSCNDRRHSSPNASHRRRACSAARRPCWTAGRSSRVRHVIPGAPSPSRRTGLVPDAADGQHDLRVLGIALDLGPQPLDVHVHQPGVGGVPVAPDLLQQHLPGEHLARLARQRHQQVELQRRELDRPALAQHLVTGDVDAQVPDRQRLRRLVLGPPQPRPDPRDQLLRLERLDHVVVRAGLQAQHHVHGVALRRQHDDRDA